MTADPKTIVAYVDSNAVSIFVDILVELKNSVFVYDEVLGQLTFSFSLHQCREISKEILNI